MLSMQALTRVMVWFVALALLIVLLPQQTIRGAHTTNPTSVTIAGDLQSELGCAGDWDPSCTNTFLTYDGADDVWQGTFDLPAGEWEYKAPLNGSWDENYGRGAVSNGPNIGLSLAEARSTRFYYDHKSHWVTDNANSVIAVAVGNFQAALGCPGDWQPDCLRSWLQDPDGDSVYIFSTTALVAGSYEGKVAINESWDENYGAGGVPNGANIPFTVARDNQEVAFVYTAATNMLEIVVGGIRGDLGRARAHWLTRDTIAWNVPHSQGNRYELVASPTAGLALSPEGVTGGTTLTLTHDPNGLDAALTARFPHLASYQAYKLAPADLARVPELLRGQLAVQAFNAAGDMLDATSMQIPGVLDDLYTYSGPLGVTFADATPTLRVWAPTAQSVRLHRFASSTSAEATVVDMTFDATSGVWTAAGEASWTNQYYLYEVRVYAPSEREIVTNLVTDPYSLSLSMNSTRSQIINLDDARLKPPGWENVYKPPLAAPEDVVVYELHIRDFSAYDENVPAAQRGTFAAFTLPDANGVRHLRALSEAGLTHLHLLPAFDCATIDEDKSTWVQFDEDLLGSFPPDSEEQQELIYASRDQDGFNWCYDPFHFTAPEGSYSTEPDGPQRILEFRQMVQALNGMGLRVVMDVVYNHTAQSGQSPKSVLDKVVPGYYHRLSLDGMIERSTCCENTATEHAMMEKLMVDSLVTWATAYKVDGFRFDLMGHHMRSNMERVRDTLRGLTPAEHGVNGAQIYLYGEGWDFGEVANNARGVNATQQNMFGAGLGTFNDRIRDAARGGGPFDSGENLKRQGFATGLFYDPNDLDQGTPAEQRARLLLHQDQIRVGLAGNLRDYRFINRAGEEVTGAGVDYNGSPTGYAADPQETVNYVEAHDNLTLFDGVLLKAQENRTLAERVRMHWMASDVVALAQGVPFFHAGQDLLRSKSFTRDSYNAGDWFNRLDFTYQTNNFGVGLAPEEQANWPIHRPLLANPALKPDSELIIASRMHFEEMLRIRTSSPLFRLRTAEEIQAQVSFLNTGPEQVPGLIAMRLSDPSRINLANPFKEIVVIFNATTEEQVVQVDAVAGMDLRLHPVQQASNDAVVRGASFAGATGSFTVPPQTTAVFVQARYQIILPIIVR